MNPRPWMFPLLLAMAAVLFGIGIGRYDLWPADEPRFGQVAREMIESGDYLVPRINGETYLEKPPLLFWAMALCATPFGDVTETAARLPSVAGGLLTVVLGYLLARRIFGPQAALWAIVIMITGHRIWWNARTAQIDMLLTGCTTTALYALWRWDEDRKARWLALLWGATAAGMLAKGPPALVFPLLCLLVFYRREPYARKAAHWLFGTLAACAIVALWFVPARLAGAETEAQALESGMAGNLFRNTIGRMFLGVSKAEPPWYYLSTVPADLAPWTLFLPWTLYWTWRERRAHRGMRFLLAWTVPAFVFFSISVGKRSIYLLPIFPVLSILVAASLCALMDEDRPAWRRAFGRAWAALAALTPAAAIAGYFLLQRGLYADLAPVMLPIAGLGALMALSSVAALFLRGPWRLPQLVAVQTTVLLLVLATVVFPGVNGVKGASGFCAPVRQLAEAGAEFRLYSLGFTREQFIYYAHKPHTPVLTGLVPMEGLENADPIELARLQIRARKLIAEAVENVPIADIENLTEAERGALRAALEAAIDGTGEHAAALHWFEASLRNALDAYLAEFDSGGPAFMFVQDEDWRWLLPVFSKPPQLAVIVHEPVGSRHVLLLANNAGKTLLGL